MPKVPGGDLAGVIVEAPEGSGFKPGDRVFALAESYKNTIAWGTYSQYIVIPTQHLAKIPEGHSFQDAAAMPLVFLTAWQALDTANLHTGQHIMIHAGSGGVGTAAIQLAKARGLKVTTTASAENADFLKDLGADHVIDYKSARFEATCERPVHAVIDTIGGDYETRSLGLLDRSGSFISLLAKPEPLKILLGKLRAWFRLGPHYYIMSVQPNGQQLGEVAKLWESGTVKLIIHATFALQEAAQAHRLQETGKCRGKVVLNVQDVGQGSAEVQVAR